MVEKRRETRRFAVALGLAAGIVLGGKTGHAQGVGSASAAPVPGFYSAPGFYGTTFGVPGYKSIRTYSEFSSPYGAGYGYGLGPYTIGTGRHWADLWWSSTAVVPPLDGASLRSYRTFAVPYNPAVKSLTPPFGVYAPAYGPTHPYPPSAYFGR